MASSQSDTLPTILLLDLPPKTFVGINLLTFDSSPDFRGISHVPPGFYLLYTGTDASISVRHGHWFQVFPPTAATPSQTLVWQWKQEEEQLEPVHTEEGSISLPSPAGRGLVSYTALQEATSDLNVQRATSTDLNAASSSETPVPTWSSLTTHISSALLNRILPQHDTTKPSNRSRSTQTWPISSLTSTKADAEAAARQIPGLTFSEAQPTLSAEATLSLLPIDLARTFPVASTGSTRTAAARDRSWYLSHLIDTISPPPRSAGAAQVLGELQFTFLAVLTLSNYSALEGWKRLLDVLLTCSSALTEIPAFFTHAVRILRLQVCMFDEVEGGLFELSEAAGGGAWLRKLLRRFRRAMDEAGLAGGEGEKGELEVELGKLETIMRERYGWNDVGAAVLRRGIVQLEDGEEVEVQLDGFDEEEETGEWAPVVVEI